MSFAFDTFRLLKSIKEVIFDTYLKLMSLLKKEEKKKTIIKNTTRKSMVE